VEVRLLGTAVAGPGVAAGAPWLYDLSGQEWWALRRAGYDPVGLVYGHCAWFVLTTDLDVLRTGRFKPSGELEHYSEALAQCRKRADGTVRRMARQAHAHGVVGVRIWRQVEAFRLGGPRAAQGMQASSQVQDPVSAPALEPGTPAWRRRGRRPAMESEQHTLTLSIIGTAIRLRKDAPRAIRPARPVLSLRDGALVLGVDAAGQAGHE
jgi:hypothetical protein